MRYVSIVLIAVFLSVGFLGLPTLLSGEHHGGCPLLVGQAVLCESTILEHQALWHALLASVLLLFALLVGVWYESHVGLVRITPHRRFSTRSLRSLMRDLYSRGIHNRKEAPYCALTC